MKKFNRTLIVIVFITFFGNISYGQMFQIKGYVKDEKGSALPFATIFFKSEHLKGTSSNSLGEFSLQTDNINKHLKDSIIISFVGYKKEKIPFEVFSKGVFNVILKEDAVLLQEVEISQKAGKKKRVPQSILELIILQIRQDFPEKPIKYFGHIDMTGSSSGKVLGYQKANFELIENIKKDKSERVNIVIKDVTQFIDLKARSKVIAFDKLSNNKTSSKNDIKEFQNLKSEQIYKAFWANTIKKTEGLLKDNPKKWSIISSTDNTYTLAFTESKNYIGIVKYEFTLHLTIERTSYSITNLEQYVWGKIFIPFGYKLDKDMLAALNIFNVEAKDITKFRLKRVEGTIKQAASYVPFENRRVVNNINFSSQVKLESSKDIVDIGARGFLNINKVELDGFSEFTAQELGESAKIKMIDVSKK